MQPAEIIENRMPSLPNSLDQSKLTLDNCMDHCHAAFGQWVNALNPAVGGFFAAVAGSLLFHCTDG